MARLTTAYLCQNCGSESSKWAGKCYECGAWNSLVEEVEERGTSQKNTKLVEALGNAQNPQKLSELLSDKTDSFHKRTISGFGELDRVLGGGFVESSLCLFGGEPGIGKSTLLLQLVLKLSENKKCPYISGEESVSQIAGRARRLGASSNENLEFLSTNNLEEAIAIAEKIKPDFLVVDSVQTLQSLEIESASASVSQVKMVCEKFMKLAKGKGITTLLVGHVTKEGNLAGPRLLEHMVDAVFYFELAASGGYRMLRATKNRFGATNELAVFEMSDRGLKEVLNPSERFLAERPKGMAGSAIIAHLEGSRLFLTEVQAIVTKCHFGYPRRTVQGVDANRVSVLIAVLENTLGISFGDQDVYCKVASGARIEEPAADFPMLGVLMSARTGKAIPEDLILIGEVGLGGELRSVSGIEARIKEAQSVGMKRALIPSWNSKELKAPKGFEVVGIKSILSLKDFV